VVPLARSLLAGTVARLGRTITGFSPGACERLLAHDWPGNVRELQNAIERAVALTHGSVIEPHDLPKLESRSGPHADPGALARAHAADHRRLDMSLDAVEREHILSVLDACAGNKAEAARRLGIGTATLFRKLERFHG
jgi:two-component system, NtrC family, response regulator HydG